MSENYFSSPELVAYKIGPGPGMPLVPASSARQRTHAALEHAVTPEHALVQSGPARSASRAGWLILNDQPFTACWDGGTGRSSLRIRPTGEDVNLRAISFSGYGILTFYIPYLFRTPADFNLLARGPANVVLDGVTPLEGLVETDWAVANFTMNWKLTRPGLDVTFGEGQPVCMLVPQRKGELESFAAHLREHAPEIPDGT